MGFILKQFLNIIKRINNFQDTLNYRKVLSMLSLITILCISLTITAYADTGNFSRSASSRSSHSSSSPNNSNSLNNSTTSKSLNQSSSASSGNNTWVVYPFIGGMLLFMGIIAYNQYQKKNQYGNTDLNNEFITDVNYEQTVLQKIESFDENFDVNKFKTRVGNMFMSLQEAWEKKDWKLVRPYENDNLFNMHSQQLQEYINKNQTNIMDNICIKSITLKDFYNNQNTMIDSIDVIIEASFIDYVKDDRTGNIITGDNTRPIFMRYKWTLIRKSGVKSKIDNNSIQSTSCPNCGAPVSIGASGECEYCHSIVTSGDYDWVLTSIEA